MCSLQVKGEIKALQTLAVVCSLLRHFSSVVVGVTRPQDHKYITDTVQPCLFLLSLHLTV